MGTVTNLDGFWNKENDKSLSNRQLRKTKKKTRKARNRAKRAERRMRVIKYFGLDDYASAAGICFCICRETGWEMPQRKSRYMEIIKKFADQLDRERKYRTKKDKPESTEDFYKSRAWRELRFIALRNSEGRCNLCGGRASDGLTLHVDHIKPRSKFPGLALDLDNLQVLCEDCNFGKSNYDDTDYRNW